MSNYDDTYMLILITQLVIMIFNNVYNMRTTCSDSSNQIQPTARHVRTCSINAQNLLQFSHTVQYKEIAIEFGNTNQSYCRLQYRPILLQIAIHEETQLQIAIQRKCNCKLQYKWTLTVICDSKSMELRIAIQRNCNCKLHYEIDPIVICKTNGILLQIATQQECNFDRLRSVSY